MQSGPDLQTLVSQLDKAISKGLRSQRIMRENDAMVYTVPEMNALFLANMKFTENVNSTNLIAVKKAVQDCQGDDSFDWATIKTILAELDAILPQEKRKARPA